MKTNAKNTVNCSGPWWTALKRVGSQSILFDRGRSALCLGEPILTSVVSRLGQWSICGTKKVKYHKLLGIELWFRVFLYDCERSKIAAGIGQLLPLEINLRQASRCSRKPSEAVAVVPSTLLESYSNFSPASFWHLFNIFLKRCIEFFEKMLKIAS